MFWASFDSVGKGACCQAWWPLSLIPRTHDRRELTPTNGSNFHMHALTLTHKNIYKVSGKKCKSGTKLVLCSELVSLYNPGWPYLLPLPPCGITMLDQGTHFSTVIRKTKHSKWHSTLRTWFLFLLTFHLSEVNTSPHQLHKATAWLHSSILVLIRASKSTVGPEHSFSQLLAMAQLQAGQALQRTLLLSQGTSQAFLRPPGQFLLVDMLKDRRC